MRLGETIATYDVGLALRGKSGKFEITTPDGEIFDVTWKPNHPISDLEWSSDRTDTPPFLIRKVADSVSLAEAKVATTGMREESQAASSRLPLVLERARDEGHSSHFSTIELLYLDDDQGTGEPSACIYLKSELRDYEFEAGKLMTPRCASFNELDSEIRRIQAQLDDIRSRGKKMFYKSQAIAASA
jgi:hypothetical protein